VAAPEIEQTFTVRALDKFGFEQETGGEEDLFRVRIVAPVEVVNTDDTVTLEERIFLEFKLDETTDQGDGTYLTTYQVAKSGTFSLHITFNNDTRANMDVCANQFLTPCGEYDIIGSPFPLIVEPGSTSPVHCALVGVDTISPIAGQPTLFTVQTKDTFGNNGKYDAYGIDLVVWALLKPKIFGTLENIGKQCRVPCEHKSGSCDWCGTSGKCCRNGDGGTYSDDNGDCSVAEQESSSTTRWECVAPISEVDDVQVRVKSNLDGTYAASFTALVSYILQALRHSATSCSQSLQEYF
jgi:hypothetical protein